MDLYGTEVLGSQNICCYTHRELQMATGNFNSANKVGEGGFGSVYKVILHAYVFMKNLEGILRVLICYY
jgi:hypothetical protein